MPSRLRRPPPATGPRADLTTLLTVGATGLLLGPLAGLAWWVVAPRPVLVVAGDGLRYTDGAPAAFFGADGWFTVITLVIGLATGIAVFAWRGRTGLPALFGLLLSAAIGTFLAWHLGEYLGGRSVPTDAQATASKVGTRITARLQLRSQGALPVWAIAATTAFFSLSLGFNDDGHPSRRRERHDGRRRRSPDQGSYASAQATTPEPSGRADTATSGDTADSSDGGGGCVSADG